MKKKLTPKQQRFCEEYVVDFNATQAAIRAGYSPKTAYEIGHQNLKKLEITEVIAATQQKLSEKTEINQEYVIRSLHTIAERCMQAEQVKDKDGKPIGDYKFDSSGANRSVELIGRTFGQFVDKVKTEDVTKHEFWTKLLQKVENGEITKEEAAKAMGEVNK